jgi:MYXO-CTERM domain-containing protein
MDRIQSLLERNSMRKTLGVSLTALTLLFGGAGVAQAATPIGSMPSSTTTMAADTDEGDSDNTGLWGLAGLLGLLGLAGLKRRNDRDVTADTTVRGPSAPRV